MALTNLMPPVIPPVVGQRILTKTPTLPPRNDKKTHFFPDDGSRLRVVNLRKEELQRKVNDEVNRFSDLLQNANVIMNISSTADFWTTYRNEFPNLRYLAIILLGIPSSSASVERFICFFTLTLKNLLFLNLY